MIFDQERLALALDDCIQRMRHEGAGIEECLSAYRDMRPTLEPLLRTSSLFDRGTPQAPAEIEAAYQRARVMRLVRAGATTRERNRAAAWNLRRFAFAPVLALALVAALLFGLTTAHTPGDDNTNAILTVFGENVRVERSDGSSFAAGNGTVLKPGERVLTSEGAGAVLTFYDGSTVTLGNDTVVDLNAVFENNGKVTVNVTQLQGNTWTHIPAAITDAQVQIDTPTARVNGNDALFFTQVKPDGGTQVGSESGALQVTSGGTQTNVGTGYVASVATTGQVSVPNPAVAPPRSLTIRVTGATAVYVTDPTGATVGNLGGVPVNQVSGATMANSGGAITISLPDPKDGTYRLSVKAPGSGAVQVSAAVTGRAARQDADSLDGSAGDWSGGLVLSGDDVSLQQFALAQQDVKPAPVTIPARAAEKATSAGAASASLAQGQAVAVLPTVEPSNTPEPVATPVIASAAAAASAASAAKALPTATTTPTATPAPTKPTSTPMPSPTSTPRPKAISTATFDSPAQPISVDSLR